MIDQAPQIEIPKEVVNFARSENYRVINKNYFFSNIQPFKDFQEVYTGYKNDDTQSLIYILVKDKQIRFSTEQETLDILNSQPYL